MNNNLISQQPILKINHISVIIAGKYLLHNISFDINRGELVTIVGKNGAGKTTLCKTIIGNIKPTLGSIQKTSKLKISYVPQIQKYNALVPISVYKFLLLNNKKTLSQSDHDLLDLLDIKDLLQKQFAEISGGEKQRVILMRSIISQPDLLILDEPTSFIDFASKRGIYEIINNLKQNKTMGIIVVSHDLHLVLKDTNHIVCLKNGSMGCQGKASDITQNDSFIDVFTENWQYYKHND